MEFEIKNIPTVFVTIAGKSVRASDVLCVLEDFADYDELNDYNTIEEIAGLLVEEGVLETKRGSRMAKLFVKTDKTEEFYNKFYDEYSNYSEENIIYTEEEEN